jgi:MYXO-CTERM domain-containing protein
MRPLAASIALVVLLAWSGRASAFCRSRTCDAADPAEHCVKDANLCVTSGRELHWDTSCITFDAQADGSPALGIDADALTTVIERAFASWLQAPCGKGTPSLEVATFGPVECAESKFKDDLKNANIVMFRDDVWPYPGSLDAYALTVVHYNTDTGQIVDADIEINSADFDLKTDDAGKGIDLQTVLTHEIGHFLGLAHAAPNNTSATMRPLWDGKGTDLRTLSPDDVAGICAIYPPDRRAPRTCEPLHGFGSGCNEPAADAEDSSGCSVGRGRGASRLEAWLALLGFVLVLRRRRPAHHAFVAKA